MALFDQVVNRETVASFGFDMSVWQEDHQALLHEGMILAWKENPDWTEEQAKAECRKQATRILFDWFTQHYGYAVEDSNYWTSKKAAFKTFMSMPLVKFIEFLEEQREFNRFGMTFYNDLREMYNIDAEGVWDEFQRMKKNKWQFSDYRKWLDKEIKKIRKG